MKAIDLVNDPEHAEPLQSDSETSMTALQRTQAMQLFVLENDMTFWAERNIFGPAFAEVTATLLAELRKLISHRVQFLAEGEHQDPPPLATDEHNSSSETESSPDSSPTLSLRSPHSPTHHEIMKIRRLITEALKSGIDLGKLAEALKTAEKDDRDFSTLVPGFNKVLSGRYTPPPPGCGSSSPAAAGQFSRVSATPPPSPEKSNPDAPNLPGESQGGKAFRK